VDEAVGGQRAQRPAAVLVNAHGDYLIALPTIRALASLFPGLRLVGRAGSAAAMVGDTPSVTVVETACWFGAAAWEFDADAVAALLRPADLLLLLDSYDSAAVAALAAELDPDAVVGPPGALAVPASAATGRHEADRVFAVAQALAPELRIEAFAGPPRFAARSRRLAADLCAVLPPTARRVVVHADTKPEKRWPADRFVAVLDRLLDRHPEALVLDLGREDLRLDAGRHGDRVIPCGRLPLPAALALIEGADLFLGVDSVALHAADLCGVPGVGLFGPTTAARFGFRFAPHRHLDGGGSLFDISVDEVLWAVQDLEDELCASARSTGLNLSSS
jgi:hypothetical protein